VRLRLQDAGVPSKMPNKYQQLITEVNDLTARLSERYRAHLQCQSGCSGCCQHHLSVFPVEAANIKSAIQYLPQIFQERIHQQAISIVKHKTEICPLLVDDKCSVYDSRPIICRTQGLPLLFEAVDGNQEVDFCPLNFTDENAADALEENQLVPLDALNMKLSIANLEFCQAHEIEPNQRIKIGDLCS
jgi:uncharacterized protein